MKKIIAMIAVALCTTLTVSAQETLQIEHAPSTPMEAIKCDVWLSSNSCVKGTIEWEHGHGLTLYIPGEKTPTFYTETILKEGLFNLRNAVIVRNYDGKYIPCIEKSRKNISESGNVSEFTFISMFEKDGDALVGDFMSNSTTFRKGTEE